MKPSLAQAQLDLHFTECDGTISLHHAIFTVAGFSRRSIRGKGSLTGFGCFQWSFAVRALSQLMIRHHLAALDSSVNRILLGGHGSPAASLDYALSKETGWLCDLFSGAVAPAGLLRRLFRRINSNRKQPGPVVIEVNERLLPPSGISINLNGKLVSSVEGLCEVLLAIEAEDPELRRHAA